MAEFKIGKTFLQPLGLPGTYYVQCSECNRVEGRIINSTNRLTAGTGDTADSFKERGWSFTNGEWTCPNH